MNLNDANLFSGVLGENQIKVNEPMSRHTTFGIGGPDRRIMHHYQTGQEE